VYLLARHYHIELADARCKPNAKPWLVHKDLNPEPVGYEPSALTIELKTPKWQQMQPSLKWMDLVRKAWNSNRILPFIPLPGPELNATRSSNRVNFKLPISLVH
jgi:hypothetical protein